MKTLPAMLGTRKLFCVFFLILYLGLQSIHGEESCAVELRIRRNSEHTVAARTFFKMECPVRYCGHRPNVTWCKLNGADCFLPEDRFRIRTSWEERFNKSIFMLHFELVLPSDNGSYRCSVNASSHVIHSHSITIHVTEQAQNNSEHALTNTTSVSEPPSKEEMADVLRLLYNLLPLGGFPLLVIACFCLFYCLKRHQGKRKKTSDMAERESNLGNVIQPLTCEPTEVNTRQNSQTPPLEAEMHDSDPWFRTQEGSEVYSNPHLEENKQVIVYASLNHSIIRMNPRQASNVKEAPTEYASICVRS
ncbi:B- and T-lymphocyte attenuator isoform X2 [Cavia porcellus]|uniref:B and T lymphocyte associated n=1 Tax=Cavia porcellus TaxID=10141 RepID=A0A286Y2X8_CAVPO|nr:B- and T-lymphocyte attenuator [Cavia porcellus]